MEDHQLGVFQDVALGFSVKKGGNVCQKLVVGCQLLRHDELVVFGGNERQIVRFEWKCWRRM